MKRLIIALLFLPMISIRIQTYKMNYWGKGDVIR